MAASTIKFNLNGSPVSTSWDPNTPLLYILRDQFELNGPRFGCGLGECGCCTVHVNGEAVRSCSVPASFAANATVTTLEGLGTAGKPSVLQQAFIDEQAAQCGYCSNGMIMQAAALLKQNPHPTEAEVRQALQYNLCRCGTHLRYIRAVLRAAEQGA